MALLVWNFEYLKNTYYSQRTIVPIIKGLVKNYELLLMTQLTFVSSATHLLKPVNKM